MAKRKRAKYSHGGSHVSKTFNNIGEFSGSVGGNQNQISFAADYQSPEKLHSFGVRGSSTQGVTSLTGSTEIANTKLQADVGVGVRKGQYGVTASRNLGAGEISATVKQQPKPFSYGQTTYFGIGFTKRF